MHRPTHWESSAKDPTREIAPVVSYEDRLSADIRWAMSEGDRYFNQDSSVFRTLRKVAARLEALGIPYALVGGMALFHHGLRRFTEDVDLLVTREDLHRIHDQLAGLGYVPVHRLSKNLRDAEYGVKVEFLITGDFPGDGKPKPVAFPDPRDVSIDADGLRLISIEKLIELKLASGMTNPDRMKDITDVRELIKALNLPLEFKDRLDLFVRAKYVELWSIRRKRFVTIWRSADRRPDAATLEHMKSEGVEIHETGGHLHLSTTDPEVAKHYDMIEEIELWGERDAPSAPA